MTNKDFPGHSNDLKSLSALESFSLAKKLHTNWAKDLTKRSHTERDWLNKEKIKGKLN